MEKHLSRRRLSLTWLLIAVEFSEEGKWSISTTPVRRSFQSVFASQLEAGMPLCSLGLEGSYAQRDSFGQHSRRSSESLQETQLPGETEPRSSVWSSALDRTVADSVQPGKRNGLRCE